MYREHTVVEKERKPDDSRERRYFYDHGSERANIV